MKFSKKLMVCIGALLASFATSCGGGGGSGADYQELTWKQLTSGSKILVLSRPEAGMELTITEMNKEGILGTGIVRFGYDSERYSVDICNVTGTTEKGDAADDEESPMRTMTFRILFTGDPVPIGRGGEDAVNKFFNSGHNYNFAVQTESIIEFELPGGQQGTWSWPIKLLSGETSNETNDDDENKTKPVERILQGSLILLTP